MAELHDPKNLKPGCKLDAVISDGYDVAYETVADGVAAGFGFCPWCLGDDPTPAADS